MSTNRLEQLLETKQNRNYVKGSSDEYFEEVKNYMTDSKLGPELIANTLLKCNGDVLKTLTLIFAMALELGLELERTKIPIRKGAAIQ